MLACCCRKGDGGGGGGGSDEGCGEGGGGDGGGGDGTGEGGSGEGGGEGGGVEGGSDGGGGEGGVNLNAAPSQRRTECGREPCARPSGGSRTDFVAVRGGRVVHDVSSSAMTRQRSFESVHSNSTRHGAELHCRSGREQSNARKARAGWQWHSCDKDRTSTA